MRHKAATALELKEYKNAIKYCDGLLENKLDPGFLFVAHQIKGEAFYYLREYKQSIEVLHKSVEILDQNPNSFKLLSGDKIISFRFMGLSYHGLNEYNKALEIFNKMTKLDKKKFSGLLESAELLIKIKKYGEAEKTLRDVIEVTKNWPNSNLWKEEVRSLRERIRRAKKDEE